jgi:hypothetical protein
MAKIPLANMMSALAEMQMDIDKHKEESSMWFTRFLEEEKAKRDLQARIDELTAAYAQKCEEAL